MRGRLAIPAAIGVSVVVICVLAGIHGIEPLLAFGLGAFAAASAGRALVLSVRSAWRSAKAGGASPARAALSGWRGLVGRANGGMIVHIGVVLVAVGLSAAAGFRHDGQVSLQRGQTATVAGHTVEFIGSRNVVSSSHSELRAVLEVDGGGRFYPAISQFGTDTQTVGTPAIDSGFRDDVYLTIANIDAKGVTWTFRVVVQPLVAWLWAGGALIVIGSILSAIPGRRRRPTAPVSASVLGTSGSAGPDWGHGPDGEKGAGEPGDSGGADRTGAGATDLGSAPEPVGAGERS
jgi:cytochrome c-type biogenesis protein CcmF